ncbi:hypothetical protein FH972_027170 [Carpinus fangiana]|uniref:Uncharacterized protein n=1 Tax=Carpinus fangiana TaxID=176857 RepID=A0A5N6L6Y1_9ROSI|nr:hypothetical protein FH972_027170 [Carpinus fangiana]
MAPNDPYSKVMCPERLAFSAKQGLGLHRVESVSVCLHHRHQAIAEREAFWGMAIGEAPLWMRMMLKLEMMEGIGHQVSDLKQM